MARRKSTTPPSRPIQSSRRIPRTIAIAAVLAIALAAGAWWIRSPPTSGQGAVVLISIDTLRADRLPVYGYPAGRTPVIDRLAKESIVFERAYAHAPQTLPSHASMFTGLLPFEHKVRDNLGFTLPEGATTLGSLMRTAGYRTAGFVSAYVLRQQTGIGQGFEAYNAEFPAVSADRSPAQVQRPGSSTLTAASAWLDTLPNDRFFLFFHIYEPHKPYAPPTQYASMEPYDGEVAYSDEIVGHLLEKLHQKDWYERATVILTSDHGEGLGDHGEQEHGLFVYDEVIRAPLIVKLPGNSGAGKRVAQPAQHIDLLPTIAALAGFSPPAGLRGRNLLPVLSGTGDISPQGIYSEALYPRYHFGWSELLALTDERYRYIKAPREELYDLEKDPDERDNIIDQRPQVAAALRGGLETLVADRAIDAPSTVTAEDRERLAALGYVGTQTSSRSSRPAGSLPDPKDKAHILSRYREAVDLVGQRRLAEGARLMRLILDEDPLMTDVWSQYAAVMMRLGRPRDALAAYQQMIRANPEEPSGLLGAASVLLALGRLDEARQHAELAVNPAPALAHQSLANIAIQAKDYDEALRQAAAAEKADPGLPLVELTRGVIQYQQQHYEEALPHLMRARDAYAKRALQPVDLHFFIGDALARLERYPEAEPYLLQEVRLYPQSIRGRAGLALLYQSTGRTADAAKAIDDMTRASSSPEAYATAAKIWRMFGQPERAAAVEKEARSRFAQ